MAEVQHWTQAQQDERKNKFPLSYVKPWAVMDGKILAGFFDTEEEAVKEAARINRDDKIAESFNEWESAAELEFSVDCETIKEIVESQL